MFCSRSCRFERERAEFKKTNFIQKKCKLCNEKFVFNKRFDRVFCSLKCHNTWQARYNNGFKGKTHTQELKKRWAVERKETYNLDNHKKDCICNFCKTVRGEAKPPMDSLATRIKVAKKLKGRKIYWANKVKLGVLKAYAEGRLRARKGKECSSYIDGRTPLRKMIRDCREYKQWVLAVFKRDNYTCQECGDSKGGNLQSHHIKPFNVMLTEFLKKYNYFSPIEDKETLFRIAINDYPDFWNADIGKTLCIKCHRKINTRRTIHL